MWLDIHPEWADKVKETDEVTTDWIRMRLSEGTLVGFVARTMDGKVAGSGCVWVREEQPRPTNPGQKFPYLMSMYTEKEFRRQGVAKKVAEAAIRWCRENGYDRLVLHASDEGKPLYAALGFQPSREMRLIL